MKLSEPDARLWHLLFGAMIASKEFRTRVVGKISPDDVPTDLKDAWRCVARPDPEGMRAIGVGWNIPDREGETFLGNLVRQLQQQALSRISQQALTAIRNTAVLTPDEVLELLEGLTTKIMARKTALENPVEESGNRGSK